MEEVSKILIILVTAWMAAAEAVGQTERGDTAKTMRVGYFSGSLNTLAGAVDKVTEDRMNKGLVTSSLDALTGQAAGVQVTTGGNQVYDYL